MLYNQTVLQGAIEASYPIFRLPRIRADNFDFTRVECFFELCLDAFRGSPNTICGTKGGMLVALKRDRSAVIFEVLLGRVQVIEG